jgi:uncharacterized protein (TIGR02284 family)
MRKADERAVVVTNGLIQICADCESALRTATDVAESAELRDGYRERAAVWAALCAALRNAVRELGGEPPESPGVTGTLQRAWIKIKSAVGDTAAIAAECSKREAIALGQCMRAVEGGLPGAVQELVQQFLQSVAPPPQPPPGPAWAAARGRTDLQSEGRVRHGAQRAEFTKGRGERS